MNTQRDAAWRLKWLQSKDGLEIEVNRPGFAGGCFLSKSRRHRGLLRHRSCTSWRASRSSASAGGMLPESGSSEPAILNQSHPLQRRELDSLE